MPKYAKVNYLPLMVGVVLTKNVLEDIKRLFPGQPRNMDYRKEFLKGRGASTKDSTWNRKQHRHICCDSRVPWRHKAKCAQVTALQSDDYGDLKDPDLL